MPELQLFLDGEPLAARPGQTVGAALTEAGVTSWRTTLRGGRPRGLFCGIGVCFDCLLMVDGVPNQRACLTPARDGMELETGTSTQTRPDKADTDDTAPGGVVSGSVAAMDGGAEV
ncbi:proline dehydrogenase [Arthrobacter livingstonensis]|uniref:Proline dehydrogenase n=1 Tax=Arthrobacter livingstonensis TaxID=670078 RepID=A0A2V5L913_9MICC|nr:(2Fe-2S)-binding protein [Arthrobacter livingstonensis]PYI66904.1 proline dehydrogenase [Arthrobacter livingstonensis]